MSDHEFGSLTLWRRLYEQPEEPGLWEEFVRRYKGLVLRWTRKWLRDSNDDEEMFAEFCKRVHEHIRGGSKKQLEPRDDSYRKVLYRIVHNLCMDYLARKGNRPSTSNPDATRAERERWSQQATVDFFEGLDDLDEQEIRKRRAIEQLAAYRQLFREALIRRKAQPQYDPKSTAIFFKKYHEVVPTERLDEEYELKSRDSSGRYARRERDRLIKLMGLPTGAEGEAKLSEVIVTVLARVYGDVSTMPE